MNVGPGLNFLVDEDWIIVSDPIILLVSDPIICDPIICDPIICESRSGILNSGLPQRRLRNEPKKTNEPL